jgi:FkbM family methyltransferase
MLRARRFVRTLLSKLGLSVIRLSSLQKLELSHGRWNPIERWKAAGVQDQDLLNLVKYGHLSQAQIQQDIFVLNYHGTSPGYFVEFGATDGKTISNTFMLEKQFGWNGILAEPAISWREDLLKNRNCSLDFRCVWKESGSELEFAEVQDALMSTINSFSSSDIHANARRNKKLYRVETISLNDLLSQHNAPTTIDYISIDTEGSEYEILSAFDFSKYTVKIFTIEHNFSDNREKVFQLMSKFGYERVQTEISEYDDWYLKI